MSIDFRKHAKNAVRETFRERVFRVVAAIPKGQTLTYKDVADLAGSPGAFRAVGNIMSKNFNPKIPCHRVVRSDGHIGNYNRGGSVAKIKILKKEGAWEKLQAKGRK